jgi:hypothetical protein
LKLKKFHKEVLKNRRTDCTSNNFLSDKKVSGDNYKTEINRFAVNQFTQYGTIEGSILVPDNKKRI